MTILSWVASNVLLAASLSAVAWLVQRRLQRPALAHVLWVLVLVKLATPPLIAVPLYEPPKTPCELGTCGCGPHGLSLATIVGQYMLAVWFVGVVIAGTAAWRRWRRFRRLLAHAAPAPALWQELTAQLAAELSLRRTPKVLVTSARLPPLVSPDLFRPSILLPAALLEELPRPQRSALLLHELAHVRRGHHLVRLLEAGVRVLYWWLPLVGWVGRQLRACEESCCDAAVVVHRPGVRRDYARLLLDVLDFVSPAPRTAGLATMMSAGELERRIRAILASRTKPRPAARLTAVLGVGLACVVLPIELRCDWSGFLRTKSSAASIGEPSKSAGPWTTDRDAAREFKWAFCCPS